MKVIWKYKLFIEHSQRINIPASAQILCVQKQDGIPCIWALVDPHETAVARTIVIVGTGHEAYEGYRYIGTTQDGGFVWHWFEEPAK